MGGGAAGGDDEAARDLDDAARVDGYRVVVPVTPTPDQFDRQGHLNNVAVVRILGDLRIAYVDAHLGDEWRTWLRDRSTVVVVRELHVRYEREVLPGQALLGATRVAQRRGRAGIVEQVLVDAASGEVVADAWLVQLLARDGAAVPFPDWYWDRIAAVQGAPVPVVEGAPRPAWGPPA